jgi:uncharacterized protein YktB (UPF0637 family)
MDNFMGFLTLLLYGGILFLMFTVIYKRKKRNKYRSEMRKRLKLIKGGKIDK